MVLFVRTGLSRRRVKPVSRGGHFSEPRVGLVLRPIELATEPMATGTGVCPQTVPVALTRPLECHPMSRRVRFRTIFHHRIQRVPSLRTSRARFQQCHPMTKRQKTPNVNVTLAPPEKASRNTFPCPVCTIPLEIRHSRAL